MILATSKRLLRLQLPKASDLNDSAARYRTMTGVWLDSAAHTGFRAGPLAAKCGTEVTGTRGNWPCPPPSARRDYVNDQ